MVTALTGASDNTYHQQFKMKNILTLY